MRRILLARAIPELVVWILCEDPIQSIWNALPHQSESVMPSSWIVSYDIADPKRLRKVAHICEDFGTRKQLSVFLCRLSATDFVRLRNQLYEAIDRKQDQILFIPLCSKCSNEIESLGRPTEAADQNDVVIVV